MEASKLYMARVQVVEAMEQGLPWHEADQSINRLSTAPADAGSGRTSTA